MWQAHPENLQANPIGHLFDSHAARTHVHHDEVPSTFSPMLEEYDVLNMGGSTDSSQNNLKFPVQLPLRLWDSVCMNVFH